MIAHHRIPDIRAASRSWALWWVAGNALFGSLCHPFPLLLPIAVGLGQWLLLRRLLPGLTAWWIPATWVGMLVGMAIFADPGEWLYRAAVASPRLQVLGYFHPLLLLVGLLAGLSFGAGQATIMRQWRSGLLWLVASGLGTIALFPVYMGLHRLATRIFDTPYTGRFFILGATDHPSAWTVALWLVQGLVCGAIYALPLAWVAVRAARNERHAQRPDPQTASYRTANP